MVPDAMAADADGQEGAACEGQRLVVAGHSGAVAYPKCIECLQKSCFRYFLLLPHAKNPHAAFESSACRAST